MRRSVVTVLNVNALAHRTGTEKTNEYKNLVSKFDIYQKLSNQHFNFGAQSG